MRARVLGLALTSTTLIAATLAVLLVVIGPVHGQFRGSKGGGSFGGKGGGSFGGKGGFSGGGMSFGGGNFAAMFLKDPPALFERMAKGRDHILVSDSRLFRSSLEEFAKANNITDEKISRDLFLKWAETEKTKQPSTGDSKTTSPAPGGPPSSGGSGGDKKSSSDDSGVDRRIAFSFRRRDENNNGFLEADELSSTLRANLNHWDKDNDQKISLQEYVAYAEAEQRASSSSNGRRRDDDEPSVVIDETELYAKPNVIRAGNMPDGLPSWFKEMDMDKDGQVCLAEWRDKGKEIEEYLKMDANEDALLTPQEVLAFENKGKTPDLTASSSGSGRSKSRFGSGGRGPGSFGSFGGGGSGGGRGFGPGGFGQGGFGPGGGGGRGFGPGSFGSGGGGRFGKRSGGSND